MSEQTNARGKREVAGRQKRAFRRLLNRLDVAFFCLFRRPLPGMPWSWTMTMTGMVAFALLATWLASFKDVAAFEYVRTSDLYVIKFLSAWTDVGMSQWYLVPAAALFVSMGFMDWSAMARPRRIRLARIVGHASFAFTAVAISGLLVNLFKIMAGRTRPKLFDQVGAFHFEPGTVGYIHGSFPSGHATTCGAVAMTLALWWPRYSVPLLLLGQVAAVSRLAAGAHFASDVVAGYALGVIYTLYLARWLAIRGSVFRLDDGCLIPRPR